MTNEGSSSRMRSSKGDELEARLGAFAGRVMRVVHELPTGSVGSQLRDQLLRAGTAVGAHYAEARSAQSTDDFIHKISLAAKECREALYWLRAARSTNLLDFDLSEILDEADNLVAILFKSMQTARGNNGG